MNLYYFYIDKIKIYGIIKNLQKGIDKPEKIWYTPINDWDYNSESGDYIGKEYG